MTRSRPSLPKNFSRYVRFLQAYANRQRRKLAAKWIEKISNPNWVVVELGCENGALASRVGFSQYIGFEKAGPALRRAQRRAQGRVNRGEFRETTTLTRAEIPAADLVVFLGLVDRMKTGEFSEFLGRIQSKRVLFSFTTEPTGMSFPYWGTAFGQRSRHSTDSLATILGEHGFKKCEIRRCRWLDPGRLVFAEKSSPRT